MRKVALIIFLFAHSIFAREEDKVEHIWLGNLALPTSQQPSGQLGLGQNILDKGDVLGVGSSTLFRGCNQKADFFIPTLIYGITDDFSLLVAAPIGTKLQEDSFRTSGVGDIITQLEYAFYNNDQYTYGDQATIFGNIIWPTGSARKFPALGFGGPSSLWGLTYSHLSVEWYYYLSAAALFHTKYKNSKPGNSYFYQAGLGKNLHHFQNWIMCGMVEFSGTVTQKTSSLNVFHPNSGGHTIYLGPCVFVSSHHFIFHIGLYGIIFQRLNGTQKPGKYLGLIDVGWKFH